MRIFNGFSNFNVVPIIYRQMLELVFDGTTIAIDGTMKSITNITRRHLHRSATYDDEIQDEEGPKTVAPPSQPKPLKGVGLLG